MARVFRDKRTGSWCIDYKDNQGHRRQIKAARTKTLAKLVLANRLDDMTKEKFLGTTPITKIKFDKFCEEYLIKYAKVNKRSWQRDEITIDHLQGFFGDKTLTEITTRDVDNYKAHRQSLVGNSTINREMACLKCMFNLAVKWGYAKDNPVRGVSFFKENNQRTRYLEPQERTRLLAFCPPHLKPIVIVALHTGLRKSEILNLTWSDINFDRGGIHVRQSKSGEQRYIPMNKFLTQTLKDVTKRLDSPYVFCDESGRPYKSVKKSFNNAVKKAGLKDFVFHDLRHCYGSYLTMAGIDLRTVQELMGHKTITMTLRYSHLSPSHKQAAVDKLQAFMDRGVDDSREEVAAYKQHGKLGQAAV